MYWTNGSGKIELNITKKDAATCSHPGPCDNDVAVLRNKPYIKRQLAKISADTIISELKEYGAWSEEELNNHDDNIARILWIACGDISESTI